MGYQKMLEVIDEINHEAAEREELIETIALALLSGKNLFILGDTGQGKSYCINAFRKRITGARQFERLISKQTDEEQLFGRLDLSSLIPGNLSQEVLMRDAGYAALYHQLDNLYKQYQIDGQTETLKEAEKIAGQLETTKKILCLMIPNIPKTITDGKIPDSDIVFLDEIFKANDGILNSLLTVLNERVYTNEGHTVPIPVISFFSASNEIPDFSDSAQQILKPLYDRFEMKVLTSYVEEKENRMDILSKKQNRAKGLPKAFITLSELREMQKDISKIKISDKINELMDAVLCELRRNGIHVSDRKYFDYFPVVQAKAYLRGDTEVNNKDLLALKNYFWNKPEEIPQVEKILSDFCENPVSTEVAKYLDMANEIQKDLESAYAQNPNNLRAYTKFNKEIFRIYKGLCEIRRDDMSESDVKEIGRGEQELENMSIKADKLVGMDHVTLVNRKKFNL